MNKVAIIGCPGSGKTHFSRRLADVTKLPLIHLDKIYHSLDHRNDKVELHNNWKNELDKITSKAYWITDGNYFSTLNLRLPRADTVIIFNYSRLLIFWRLLKRRVKYAHKQREDMPEGWRETLNWQFYRSHVFGYRKKYLKIAQPVIDTLKKDIQVIVFDKPKDAEHYLMCMQKENPQFPED